MKVALVVLLLAAVLSHAVTVQKRAEVEEVSPKLVEDIMDENAKEDAPVEKDQMEFASESDSSHETEVDEAGLMRFRQLAVPRDGTSSTCSGSNGALQCPFRNAVCCGSGKGKSFVASACCPVSHTCRQVGASWKCHAKGPSGAGANARQAASQLGGRFAQAVKNQQKQMSQISGNIQKAIQQLTSRAQAKQQALTSLQQQKGLQQELKTIQQLEKKAAAQASGANKPSQNIIIVKNINVLTHVPQGSNLKLSAGKKPW